MRYVPTEELELGMLTALPIYDDRGRILINGYNVLSEKYMQRIRALGVQGIYIEDDISSDVEIKDIISEDLRYRSVEAIQEKNVEVCIKVSKEIVNELLRNSTWDYGLIDIRTFDQYRYRHFVQVAILATEIGLGMGFLNDDLEHLCLAGLLLDIGMVQVEEDLTSQERFFSDMDYEQIKNHPIESFQMIDGRDDIAMTTRLGILQHHENVDGSGYPYGLKGNKIHRFAKILHVADAYDALVSKRPFRKSYTYMEAVEYLMGGCNIKFDRKTVLQFMKSIPGYPKGYPVSLSDGRKGFVIGNRKGYPLRPIIRLFDGKEIDLSEVRKTKNLTIQSVMDNEKKFR